MSVAVRHSMPCPNIMHVMRGARQLTLFSRGKKTLAHKTHKTARVPFNHYQHTVREARETSKNTLMDKMKDSYGLELTKDGKEMDVCPESRSEPQQCNELPKNTTCAGDISSDVPLQIKLDPLDPVRTTSLSVQPTAPSGQTKEFDSLSAAIYSLKIDAHNLSASITRQRREIKALEKEIRSVGKMMNRLPLAPDNAKVMDALKEDIAEAVLSLPESEERKLLSDCFRYYYQTDIK